MCAGRLCGQESACLACEEGRGLEHSQGKAWEVIAGEKGLESGMDMDFYST